MDAQFVLSAAGPADFPTDGTPEIALVGRSNVGKSSLINALVQRTLARTSGAPGKTRLINYYLIQPGFGSRGSGALYLVDLPGYGYARGGSEAQRTFETLTREYFEAGTAKIRGPQREPLIAGVLHMIDARHPDLPQDTAARTWLTGLALPICTLAMKMDKLSSSARLRLVPQLEATYGPPVITTSAETGEGIKEVWKVITEWTS